KPGYACEIPVGPSEVGDQPDFDRVAADGEGDWYGRGGLVRSQRDRSAGRGDHCDTAADQIGRKRRQPGVVVVSPAILDRDVLALDISGFAQALAKSRHKV